MFRAFSEVAFVYFVGSSGGHAQFSIFVACLGAATHAVAGYPVSCLALHGQDATDWRDLRDDRAGWNDLVLSALAGEVEGFVLLAPALEVGDSGQKERALGELRRKA